MKSIQKILLPLAFLLYLNFSIGQESDTIQIFIDSIIGILPSQRGETLFKSYIQLNYAYNRKDPEQGKAYLDKAYELAKKIDDKRLVGLAVDQMGYYQNSISQFAKAEELYLEAIKIYTDAKYDYEMPLVYNNLGVTLKNLGKTSQAVVAYEKALEYNKSENYRHGDMDVYINLGVLYSEMGNLKISNESLRKAKKLAQELNNEYRIYLAQSYRATNLVKRKDYKEALKLHFGAIPVFEKGGRNLVLGEQYYLIGSTYLEMDSLERTLENLNKSMALSNKSGETAMLGMAKRKMGEVYFKT